MQFTSAGMLNRWGTMDTEAITTRNWRAKNRKASHNAYKDPVVLWNYPGSVKITIPTFSYTDPVTFFSNLVMTNLTPTVKPFNSSLDGAIWSATNLPNGVSIDTSTGVLSGTPTEIGTFFPTIKAILNNPWKKIEPEFTFTNGINIIIYTFTERGWNEGIAYNFGVAPAAGTLFYAIDLYVTDKTQAESLYGNINTWQFDYTANGGDLTNFSQLFDSTISGRTSNITNFNEDISSWTVDNVTDMSSMFNGASSFNGDISNWEVSAVTNMSNMFNLAGSFDKPLDAWGNKTSNVTNMSGMFNGASSFNQPLNSWDVGAVTNMSYMFNGATSFNSDISSWNPAIVEDMQSMFKGASAFNGDITSWDVTSVTDMNKMFLTASLFNQNISGWTVSYVTNMEETFREAIAFNQPIGSWDVAAVKNMKGMFQFAEVFNKNISNWNVGEVITMIYMFKGAKAFNNEETGNIGNWNISNVTNIEETFRDAIAFNQDISSWNTYNVVNMKNTFNGATNFNCGNPTEMFWKTDNVQDMRGMFANTDVFNINIESWNTKNVENMSEMFYEAKKFNYNISGWNTCGLINGAADGMFQGAVDFNANVRVWPLQYSTTTSNMFNGATAMNAAPGFYPGPTPAVSDPLSYYFYGSCWDNTFDLSGIAVVPYAYEEYKPGLNQKYGQSMSISDNLLAIGIPGTGGGGSGGLDNSGNIFIYKTEDSRVSWEKISASNTLSSVNTSDVTGSGFGYSIDLSKNLLVVGAPGTINYDQNKKQKAYIYKTADSGVNWTLLGSALEGEDDDDAFGQCVKIDPYQRFIVVGAPQKFDSIQTKVGYVYIYKPSLGGVDWSDGADTANKIQLKPNILANSRGGKFGISITCSSSADNTRWFLAVGAPQYSTTSNTRIGAAYTFESTDQGVTWSYRDEMGFSSGSPSPSAAVGIPLTIAASTPLIPPDEATGNAEYFGQSMALYYPTNTLVIGQRNTNVIPFGGAAWIFKADTLMSSTAIWSVTNKLMASDASSGDTFGHSIDITEENIIVGANGDDSPSASGSAYIFASVPTAQGYNDGSWNQIAKLRAFDPSGSENDYFGDCVVIDGSCAIVAAPNKRISVPDDPYTGAIPPAGVGLVYVFNQQNLI